MLGVSAISSIAASEDQRCNFDKQFWRKYLSTYNVKNKSGIKLCCLALTGYLCFLKTGA